ncbi:hypothetical protein FRB90_003491 [Tulasnella sp. 427]|nr:hypothetical protein FRB90_003491 [Tulasnella sp. 427]
MKQEITNHQNPETDVRTSVSPASINTVLPPEMLAGIFDILYTESNIALPFPHGFEEAVEHFRRHPLLSVMLACRKWFKLVDSSPSFWTYVEIGVRDCRNRVWHKSQGSEAIRTPLEDIAAIASRIKKSGTLPLQLTVVPALFEDFGSVLGIIREHAHRLESLCTLQNPASDAAQFGGVSHEGIVQLLSIPMPSLKRLQSVRLDNNPTIDDNHRLYIDMDTPRLCQLWLSFHLALPRTTAHLTFLSIQSMVGLESIVPPIGQDQINLPELLELRLAFCSPRPILCALATPALHFLSFHSTLRLPDNGPSELPTRLPKYPHLQDLQWTDFGPEIISDIVFQHSPNITRYSNYAVGTENIPKVGLPDSPSILDLPSRVNPVTWPPLEEVQFHTISCEQALTFLDTLKTVKRMRILRDPVTALRGTSNETEAIDREKALLKQITERVDVAIGTDPWSW